MFIARICQKYEEITETIRCTPATTEELVSLDVFIEKTSEATVDELKLETDDARGHIIFLLEYAILPRM